MEMREREREREKEADSLKLFNGKIKPKEDERKDRAENICILISFLHIELKFV